MNKSDTYEIRIDKQAVCGIGNDQLPQHAMEAKGAEEASEYRFLCCDGRDCVFQVLKGRRKYCSYAESTSAPEKQTA